MSNIYYASTRNALKRGELSGTIPLDAPKTSAYSGNVYVTNYQVPHGQTGAPVFRYYYEPFGDGVIWPPLTDRVSGKAFNPLNGAQSGPGIIAWADATYINIQLFYINNTLTGTFPVYWVFYKDFIL